MLPPKKENASSLSEEKRAQLDSIVQQMESNNESEESIKFVVNDFKSKYGEVKKKSEPQGGLASQNGGVKDVIGQSQSPLLQSTFAKANEYLQSSGKGFTGVAQPVLNQEGVPQTGLTLAPGSTGTRQLKDRVSSVLFNPSPEIPKNTFGQDIPFVQKFDNSADIEFTQQKISSLEAEKEKNLSFAKTDAQRESIENRYNTLLQKQNDRLNAFTSMQQRSNESFTKSITQEPERTKMQDWTPEMNKEAVKQLQKEKE